MNANADILYVSDMASKLGRTENGIRAAIARGSASIPKPFKTGKLWCWRKADVEKWLRDKAREAKKGGA